MSASIQSPGGLKVLNPQPEITKYFNNAGTPYVSTSEVLTQIISGIRHIGLTVNVNNIEYWFKDGILDTDLVEKIPNIPQQVQSDWNEGSTSSVSYIQNKPDLSVYQPINQKDQSNGYPGLVDGKINVNQLPDSVVGNVKYQGLFNPNTDTFVPAPENKGWYYIISVSGTYSTIEFTIGDWIISDGISLSKVDNSDALLSFNGRIGNIVLNSDDVSSTFNGKLYTNGNNAGQLDLYKKGYYQVVTSFSWPAPESTGTYITGTYNNLQVYETNYAGINRPIQLFVNVTIDESGKVSAVDIIDNQNYVYDASFVFYLIPALEAYNTTPLIGIEFYVSGTGNSNNQTANVKSIQIKQDSIILGNPDDYALGTYTNFDITTPYWYIDINGNFTGRAYNANMADTATNADNAYNANNAYMLNNTWADDGTNLFSNYSSRGISTLNWLIKGNGDTGLGTTSPNTTNGRVLHLYNNLNDGTVASNSTLIIDSQNRNASLIFRKPASGNGGFTFQSNDGATTYGYLSMFQNGANQDISIILANQGRIRFYGAGATELYSIGNSNMNFWTNGVNRMTIDGSGNGTFVGTFSANSIKKSGGTSTQYLMADGSVSTLSNATSSTTGLLTSSDWTIFNNKQAALNGTGFVKITGTTISYDNTSYQAVLNGTGFVKITGTTISYDNTSYQVVLVSGTNIKTINGSSILGSGNLTVSASAGGNTTNIQFNNTGSLSGSDNFIWDNINNLLTTIRPNITTTRANGIILNNNTLSTVSVQSQYSPAISFKGNQWRSSANITLEMYMRMASNASVTNPTILEIGRSIAGAADETLLKFDGDNIWFMRGVPGTNQNISFFNNAAALGTNNSTEMWLYAGFVNFNLYTSNISRFSVRQTSSIDRSGVVNVIGANNVANSSGLGITGLLNASSGFQNGLAIFPTITQSSTASFKGIMISPYITSSGSGGNLLIDLGTNTAGAGAGTHSSVFAVNTLGKMIIGTGANTSTGTATLVAGTITISNTQVTANSLIYITRGALNATSTVGHLGYTSSAGTFTINSYKSNMTIETGDLATINWWIIN